MATKLDFPYYSQITDAHCGPAVLQMLLANLGIETTQEALTRAAGITRTIRFKGSRLDHFDKAVRKMSKKVTLWYKDHARIKDISYVIDNYHLPVAIEWQGLFGYKINPKTGRKIQINDSHYSIITDIDKLSLKITMLDPYKTFAGQTRMFSYNQLRRRWWDANDFVNQKGDMVTVYDYKLMFFIAPKNLSFSKNLGFKPASLYLKSLPL